MYISDSASHRIRKVTASTGIITTIAGSGGAGSLSGDNGAATSATLNYPKGVAVDISGNVYISDKNNQRIRKVDTSNVITSIAGGSTSGGYNGDNMAATSATLQYPLGVAADTSGAPYH